jgi:galactitol-specific phosphotransferase system IIB component
MTRSVYFVCYHGVGWSDYLAGKFLYYLRLRHIENLNVDCCGINDNQIPTINEGDIFVAKDRVILREIEKRGVYCLLYDRLLDDNLWEEKRAFESLAKIATRDW